MRPRRRVRIGRVFACGVLALGLAAAALWDRLALVLEDHPVARLKVERLFDYGLGRMLPGTPELSQLEARLTKGGHKLGASVFIRIFKAESELEVWLRRDQRYELFATYPVCRWSGRLGPKITQGDRQAPEGFYTVAGDQLNPHSRWHRSFNVGFPNLLERGQGRTGTFLMVHGGCSSAGCYAMTNPVIDEIWRLVTAAMWDGQPRFHLHIFPFRMTAQNMIRRSQSPWIEFWQDLKHGYDLFERDRVPPLVLACNGHYAFETAAASRDEAQTLAAGCPGSAATTSTPAVGAEPATVPVPLPVAAPSRARGRTPGRGRAAFARL